jgi:glycogen synthase kinase 3 beta
MEYLSDTVYRVIKSYSKVKQYVPSLIVKLYTYQLFRGLSYLHSLGICHRDIKPQNLLVSTDTHVLKICDFGSAKRLTPGEPNVAYICSRYYRPPELILGATDYTSVLDTWSMGCVMGEMLLGRPLFPGESGVDQLVEIIKVLGTPTREQLLVMVPTITEFNFPQVKSSSLGRVFKGCKAADDNSLDFMGQVLKYEPNSRIALVDTYAHAYFDELRSPDLSLPGGKPVPDYLFNFTKEEIALMGPSRLAQTLPKNYASRSSSTPTTTTTTANST